MIFGIREGVPGLAGRGPYQGVGDPVAGLRRRCYGRRGVGGVCAVGGGGGGADGVVVVAGGELLDAGAVGAGLHLHLVDVHAGLASVVALEDGVREHAVAAHHGPVVELAVEDLVSVAVAAAAVLAAGLASTCTGARADVP